MKDFRMVVFLLILFTICTLLLTGGKLAYDKASAVFNRRLYAEILNLYDYKYNEETVEADFAGRFNTVESGSRVFYVEKNPERKTVVFTTEGPGLWSQIEILLAVEPDKDELLGLRVLSQGETPGLGGRISEKAFQDSFTGLYIKPEVKVVKFATRANEVDAISGATKTSQALEVLINSGLEDLYRESDYLFPEGVS